MKIGIKKALERETPEQIEAPYREVNREIRENLIESIIANGNSVVPADVLVNVNALINDEIKVGSRPKNFKKGFTVVDAIVNGHKRIITFASTALAIKIMNYIKETYDKVDLTYEVTEV